MKSSYSKTHHKYTSKQAILLKKRIVWSWNEQGICWMKWETKVGGYKCAGKVGGLLRNEKRDFELGKLKRQRQPMECSVSFTKHAAPWPYKGKSWNVWIPPEFFPLCVHESDVATVSCCCIAVWHSWVVVLCLLCWSKRWRAEACVAVFTLDAFLFWWEHCRVSSLWFTQAWLVCMRFGLHEIEWHDSVMHVLYDVTWYNVQTVFGDTSLRTSQQSWDRVPQV